MSFKGCRVQEPPLKVVANLPYNITKLVMRKLLPLGDHFSDLFLMLQVFNLNPIILQAL